MSSPGAIWLDGAPVAALPLPDRGLEFGDGLFETLLLRNGVALFPELHLERLGRGLQRLGFPDCAGSARNYLEQAAAAVVSRGWPWSAMRLTVTRGGGPRGYAPPEPARPRFLVTASRLDRDCASMPPPARLDISSVRWSTQPLLAGLKHLNRLEQVLAGAESRRRGVDESVMLDQEERVVSVVAGNLFAVSAGRLLTPSLDGCGISGTRRQLVLQHWAPAVGLAVEEAELTVSDLAAADGLFFSNSLLPLRPVAQLGDRRWASCEACEALFRCWLETLG